MSWRITTIEDDRSRTVQPNTGTVGAFVINAAKGKEEPQLISKGQEKTLLDLYGYPSSTYPDIWDVIEFNKESECWVSAPNKSGLYGGVLATKTGSQALSVGLSDPTTFNFSAVENRQTIGTGDGVTVNFTATLNMLPYNNQTIDIEEDGTALSVVASDAATEAITHASLNTGSLVRSTGALDITYTSAPADGVVITATWTSNQASDSYFVLFNASPQDNGDTGVIITYNTNTGFFKVSFYQKDNRSRWLLIDEYTVSNVSGTFDGFGDNVYIENVLDSDHMYLWAQNNDSLVYSTFADDSSRVNLGGGDRGDALTLTEYTTGWAYFQKKTTYPADIFMDLSADAGIPSIFDTLRTTYQTYKSYILPLPDNEDVSTAKSTKSGYSINNRGLAFYWNWGKVRDNYSGTSGWYSPLIGKVGIKYAQMDDIYNALAPSWIDENNHGGQLGSGIIEMRYSPTEAQLQDLDENGINPIIFDPVYGVMIVSQRTAQSPGTLSDTSWIGHSRAFDYVIRNIRDQVLYYQITKLNDETHRNMAYSLGKSIIDPMVADNIFRQADIKCDSENNNDTILAQRKFVYQVLVKVTPFSETIQFIFTSVGQSVDIEELI